MQEIARDFDNATISQLWYPLMQVVDIKHLKIDVALGGMEQRKVHMLGKDMASTIGHNFIALHTPLITSLKGPGQKMSKSISGSGISVTDSYNEIKKTLAKHIVLKRYERKSCIANCKVNYFSVNKGTKY